MWDREPKRKEEIEKRMGQEEVLEINVSSDALELPITAFPPFKLRSSMVDKDPVIWVHLIGVYIKYIQTVLTTHVQLSEKSQQQLCLFVKTYLREIADEEGQILSLGLINVQITENLAILRAWMLELVKQLGVLRLKLNGEAVWDFAKVFAAKNATFTRGLIDGTQRPLDKRTISSIQQVQRHIESLISNGRFTKLDLQMLAYLLTENKRSKNSLSLKKKPIRRDQKSFADKFVTVSWWELLEKLYAKGQGHFAEQCKETGILSLISISTNRAAALATELGISSVHSMGLCPLFSGIVVTQEFHTLSPGFEKKLPFIRVQQKTPVNHDDVQGLIDMFPELTVMQTEKLLRKYDNNIESVTNLLLEDPEAISNPVKVESKVPTADSIMQKKVISKQTTLHVPDEHKNRTLTAALKLMYEADDDEHDDTYDEAEASNALAGGDQSKYDNIERFLWDIFKKDPQSFEKTGRKSRKRGEMKDETRWSDEQIEGWARMIQKSPKRAKILEEKYMFRGNRPQRTAFRSEQDEELDEEAGAVNDRPKNTNNKQRPKVNGAPRNVKSDHARNERSKASKANHNRKAGHDKKMASVL